ncbi:ribonuclease E/G [Oceaniglobus roseus]|uniref:ribonuclease E/G n=1 Tax=Oceaniglobus roseus TaxID=1737570 RepID=UPI000C7EB8DB|nr:ribonuclease E/G [Kandeliimicrobium roseum]
MKGRLIVLDRLDGRLAAALVEDGRLEDLLIAAPDDVPVPGAIYRAVADRPLKGQGGAILKLPEGRAYLKNAKVLAPGTPLLVQVTGYATEGKAVPVTTGVLFKSRYAIATPGKPGINVSRRVRDDARRDELQLLAREVMDGLDMGLILRSAAEHASDEALAEDILAMTDLAAKVMGDEGRDPELLADGPDPHTLAWREWPEPDTIATKDGGFAEHGIDAMISALRRPEVPLPAGGSMFVEPTRALVAVDVNTGADTSLAAGLKANIAAARALPAQLRCRGLGGQIVLDLAPMPKKDRRGFEQVLRAALKADAVETTLAGWTPLGLYELQRKRDRLPLL